MNCWMKELWLEPGNSVPWSSVLFSPVHLTLNHCKHYVLREALPSGQSWDTWEMVGMCKSGHRGSQPWKRFQNSLSIFSAHSICIGFAPCPRNHLIPHQTTRTNAGSHSLSSCKPKGNRVEGWAHLAQFLPGIWPQFSLFPPDCLLSF